MKSGISAAVLLCIHLAAAAAQAFQAPPQNISLQNVVNAVEKPFRLDSRGLPGLDNVSADFFQRSTIAAKNKEFRADGRMYLKPATSRESLKFRFDYYRPTQQQVICDGKLLWIYLPENRQVIQSDVAIFFDPARFDPSRDRAVNFLQGLGRISKDFIIKFNSPMVDTAGNFIIELTPLRASATIQKLFITVNRDSVIGRATPPPQQFGGLPDRGLNTAERAGARSPFGGTPPAGPDLQPFPLLSTTVVDHDGNSTTMEFSNFRINDLSGLSIYNFIPPATAQVVRPPTGVP